MGKNEKQKQTFTIQVQKFMIAQKQSDPYTSNENFSHPSQNSDFHSNGNNMDKENTSTHCISPDPEFQSDTEGPPEKVQDFYQISSCSSQQQQQQQQSLDLTESTRKEEKRKDGRFFLLDQA